MTLGAVWLLFQLLLPQPGWETAASGVFCNDSWLFGVV